jgi:hypothetical protein
MKIDAEVTARHNNYVEKPRAPAKTSKSASGDKVDVVDIADKVSHHRIS